MSDLKYYFCQEHGHFWYGPADDGHYHRLDRPSVALHRGPKKCWKETSKRHIEAQQRFAPSLQDWPEEVVRGEVITEMTDFEKKHDYYIEKYRKVQFCVHTTKAGDWIAGLHGNHGYKMTPVYRCIHPDDEGAEIKDRAHGAQIMRRAIDRYRDGFVISRSPPHLGKSLW